MMFMYKVCTSDLNRFRVGYFTKKDATRELLKEISLGICMSFIITAGIKLRHLPLFFCVILFTGNSRKRKSQNNNQNCYD